MDARSLSTGPLDATLEGALEAVRGRLAGQRLVLVGLTGQVGWGVAVAALAAGAHVVAVTRDAAKGTSLRSSLGNPAGLHLVAGDLSVGADAMSLGRDVAALGPVDHVFVAVGPWWQKGPTVEQAPAEYATVRAALLDAQVHAAMAFLPLVRHRAGASYTLVTGAGGHLSLPGTGLLVVALGGVFALSRMLRVEHARDAVSIHELLIETRVERKPRPGVVPAAALGVEVVRGLMAGRRAAGVHRFGSDARLHPAAP